MKHIEIKGIIPPILTPMNEDESLNLQELRNQVDRLLAGGVHGLFAFGTNGEGYILSENEKYEVLEAMIDQVKGRVPVYAGTGCISTRDTIRQSVQAEQMGADVLSIITPSFGAASQKELYDHYVAVAKHVNIPIILYNIPPRTGNRLLPETVRDLIRDVDVIVGAKDSSGDIENLKAYIRLTRELDKDAAILAGNDGAILTCLREGGSGGIAGRANIWPRTLASIYDKFVAGDLEGAQAAAGIHPSAAEGQIMGGLFGGDRHHGEGLGGQDFAEAEFTRRHPGENTLINGIVVGDGVALRLGFPFSGQSEARPYRRLGKEGGVCGIFPGKERADNPRGGGVGKEYGIAIRNGSGGGEEFPVTEDGNLPGEMPPGSAEQRFGGRCQQNALLRIKRRPDPGRVGLGGEPGKRSGIGFGDIYDIQRHQRPGVVQRYRHLPVGGGAQETEPRLRGLFSQQGWEDGGGIGQIPGGIPPAVEGENHGGIGRNGSQKREMTVLDGPFGRIHFGGLILPAKAAHGKDDAENDTDQSDQREYQPAIIHIFLQI